jgi:DnaJ family protein C protein 3
MRIFRISYFLLPPAGSFQAGPLGTLKQCLHSDPDSKPCKAAHRLVKGLDKRFAKLEAAIASEQWAQVLLLAGGPDGLLAALDAAAAEHAGQDALRYPAFAPEGKLRMPLPVPAKSSPRLAIVLGALCRAHTRGSSSRALKAAAPLAERLLGMDLDAPQMEEVGPQAAVDALLLQGEAALAREDWELAVRVFQEAFEKSGRDRDVYSRMQRAQKLLKQSKAKDYYKVLGVPRDADERTIKKALSVASICPAPTLLTVCTAQPDRREDRAS